MSALKRQINEVYKQYIDSNGHPPENATYLREYSVEIKQPILYMAAKSFLEGINGNITKKVYFQYNMEVFSVNVTGKQKYTIADLKNDVLSCIKDVSSPLIFLLESEVVDDFDMDIVQYFDVFNKTCIHFEVEQQSDICTHSLHASSDDDSYDDYYFDANIH